MGGEWFDAVPVWGLMPLTALLLCLAIEGGYRTGVWRRIRSADEKDQPVAAMVASILGLVALVLGFTFSLAASRFDARRQVVLEEANAIGTTFLRASFLPEAQKGEVERLLREYVAQRLQSIQDGNIDQFVSHSESVHAELWAQAVAAEKANPGSISVGLFVQSLNDVIDLHAKRVMVGVRSRIPMVIWIGLIGMAILGTGSIGYQAGLTISRRSPAMLCLALAFGAVLALIADLDRGQEGLLRVSQQAHIDMQESMQSPTP